MQNANGFKKNTPAPPRLTIRKFKGVLIPYANHSKIRAVKRAGHAPSIHGTKLWKSSCLIIDYLSKNPPKRQDNVLDAGCGWGITGIWCAKKWKSNVISMDADPAVFPYLEAVASLNGVTTQVVIKRFEDLRKKDLLNIDLLFGADICFWDELIKPVSNMIDRALDARVKKIVIADPERPTFHTLADRCIKKYGGELLEWRLDTPIKATGALLIINNA